MGERREGSAAGVGLDQGEKPSNVGHLTCYYWAVNGRCKYPDHVCKYAHFHTGTLAEQPIRLRPGEPAVAGTHLRMLAPYAPLTAVVANRYHPAFQGSGLTNAPSDGNLAGPLHPNRQPSAPTHGLQDETLPIARPQRGILQSRSRASPAGGSGPSWDRGTNLGPMSAITGTGAGKLEDQMTENELVSAMTTKLLKQEERGKWDHGRAKALEAAEICARIWADKYGGFGNL